LVFVTWLTCPPVWRASDLTTGAAVVVIIERRNLARLECEAPIISHHDAHNLASAFLDAVPLRALGRFGFPSVHGPCDTAIACDGVGARWKRRVVRFVVWASHGQASFV